MRVIRRSLDASIGALSITTPSGELIEREMTEVSPGRFELVYDGPEIGLYRLQTDDQNAVIGLGPAAPVEFERTIASAESLRPLISATNGGIRALADGVPGIREVRADRPAAGRGWIGIAPRGANETRSVSQMPLLPTWLVLLLVSGLILSGWLREGRR